jgi:uncharacterized protein YqjF (DUF2071 family)
MHVAAGPGHVRYASFRRHARLRAEFEAEYGPTGPVFHATAGSLEHFLTERYCLYDITPAGRPYRLDIHHRPWRLQQARAVFHRNTMAQAAQLCPAGNCKPLLHYARRQRMVAWLPRWLT